MKVHTESHWKNPDNSIETSEVFLQKLRNLLENSSHTYDNNIKNCKLCMMNTSKNSYIISGKYCKYIVPGNILHRYEKHNVKPSLNFYNFVVNNGEYLDMKILKYTEKMERIKLSQEENKEYKNIKNRDKWIRDGTMHTSNTGANIGLFGVDYIYLDKPERKTFAQVSHNYLLEQIQQNKN
jgi:hypothetical protein